MELQAKKRNRQEQLQHLKQIADRLSTDDTAREETKEANVEEVGRLRWRLWNGKTKNALISIDRIREVMPNRERSEAPSRKLWAALMELNGYLCGQSKWLVNYAERHRAGLRVGTALTEATASFLVNRRMNKSQQMRWTRRCGPPAAGPQRRLQWNSGHCLWPTVCAGPWPTPANRNGRLTPRF